jgi:hypothetical protein
MSGAEAGNTPERNELADHHYGGRHFSILDYREVDHGLLRKLICNTNIRVYAFL